MNGDEMDDLIESSVTAHRERDADGLPLAPPTWWDLAPEELDELYQRQLLARRVEQLIDPEGQSATVKAVLQRLGG